MKFITKLQKFMQGRYGPDELYNFLLILYILLFILDLFINSTIITLIELLIVLLMFYRFFSKNIYTRQKENKWYLNQKNKISKPFNNIKRNFKDRKYHVYKKCPKCKNKFKFLVLRQEKIEVIKNKKK